MRFNNSQINLLLGLVFAVLIVVIVYFAMMVTSDENKIRERERAVIGYMNIIRNAELRYRQVNGEYCGSIDSLALSGFIADSLKYIPYSNGRKFNIRTSVVEEKQGETKRLTFMECYAFYDDYLTGLDKETIDDAKKQAEAKGKFPGLKFGDIENQSDNIGNWE